VSETKPGRAQGKTKTNTYQAWLAGTGQRGRGRSSSLEVQRGKLNKPKTYVGAGGGRRHTLKGGAGRGGRNEKKFINLQKGENKKQASAEPRHVTTTGTQPRKREKCGANRGTKDSSPAKGEGGGAGGREGSTSIQGKTAGLKKKRREKGFREKKGTPKKSRGGGKIAQDGTPKRPGLEEPSCRGEGGKLGKAEQDRSSRKRKVKNN